MVRILALFNDGETLERAEEGLANAGLTDDIERVVDGGLAEASSPEPLGLGAVAPIGTDGRPEGALIADIDSNWLADYGVADEEARFLADAVNDGASLMILHSEDADEAEAILRQAGGTRIFRKESYL